MMKKHLLSTLALVVCALSLPAQYAQNSLGMGATEYLEVEDNNTLDVTGGFTFEAWILNFGGPTNQKVAGKLAADFKNGFIYGIEDLQVNFEVFDDNGTNTSMKAGSISAIGWTHVAGTYEVGGDMKIFVNGEEVGSQAASAVAINPNTNPFRIGIAPWDVNALGFVGYVDEARYWQTALNGETIRSWMHRDVSSDHPDYDNLSFYHKYNETEGIATMDETDNENWGILSSELMVYEDQALPFAGDFGLYENDVQGIWNAKQSGASDILSITGEFFDTLTLTYSALLSNSDGDYSFVAEAPGDYDRSLSKKWRAATQGEFFCDLSFDLGPIDLSSVTDVVLLRSDDEDFSDASTISGSLDGSTFTVTDLIFENGAYYTLGFVTMLSNTAEATEKEFGLEVAPNPNGGQFRLHFEQENADPVVLQVKDASGQVVWQQSLRAGKIIDQPLDLDFLPSGVYVLEARGQQQRSIRTLMIVNQ